MFKTILLSTLVATSLFGLTGCNRNDASVVSQNISEDADNFKIDRRTVFYNSITGEYILVITGKCAIDDGQKMTITCKTETGKYKKHYLRISENVTYFSEQISDANSNASHYKVTLKPSTLIGDIEVR